jgi:L-fucose mutarotase
MQLMPEHAAAGWQTPIKAVYKSICEEAEGRTIVCTEIERFAFYEAAKKAYAVVSTGETAFYANVILTKGIIGDTGK